MKTFDKLYKKSSTGADQFWQIAVDGNTIITKWGQIGGSIQETRDVIKEGKNPGKKNATTPEQQAEKEAEALWTKKLKKGYVKDLTDAKAGKVDEIIEGGVDPMLAHKFSEQAHKIKYPALVQPKFDGHRCIAVLAGGKATLWSRTRKPITGLPHIVAALEKWSGIAGRPDIVLDGELYNHDYKDNFEDLSSFIRTPDPKPGHEVVQYHIYDVADNESTFVDRHAILKAFSFQSPHLVAVETVAVTSEEALHEHEERFLEQGYEGLMVRNMAGKYVNKRSYDLQKVKQFDSSEFKVVGVEEGRGKLAGKAIFVCKHGDTEFRCKMKGKIEDLAKYVKNPSLAIGRLLEVQYFGISNANQVPRFPVGLRFRDDL